MTTPDDEGRTRPFADVLMELDRGRVHTELSAAFQDLVSAVNDTRKAGTLTIQITVKPIPKTDDQVVVSNKFGIKAPQHDRKESVFFVDADHNLTRSDPRQTELPLRGITGGATNTTPAQEAK